MDQPSKSESFSVLNIAPTGVSLKAWNRVGFLPLLFLGFTTPFLPFQDPWPSRASVESPLDGQKVSFTSLLLQVLLCPCLCSASCTCVSAFPATGSLPTHSPCLFSLYQTDRVTALWFVTPFIYRLNFILSFMNTLNFKLWEVSHLLKFSRRKKS